MAQQALRGGESAQIDSELLLAFALERSRSYLYTWPEQVLKPAQYSLFEQLLARRVDGEPIAYIIGKREFWTLSLRVNPHVLIPRPETELLVETALALLGQGPREVADLGTGSGAIALAIAQERPDCAVLATDYSAEALALARDNAQHLNIDNISFVQGSWCAALGDKRLAMIVSNPPYIDPEDPHLMRGDLRFEPSSALSAQEAGLADLRAIILGAAAHLLSDGWLLLEHGYEQGAAVRALLHEQGFDKVRTLQDINGCERVSLACLT